MDLEFLKASNLTDLQCLMQLIAHLGLSEAYSIGSLHHEEYYIGKSKSFDKSIVIYSGGGDEGSKIVFHFDKDGLVKEHYIYGPIE